MTPTDHSCTKQPHIQCDDKSRCAFCGWNPEVERLRKVRIAHGLPAIPHTKKEDHHGQEKID